MKVVLSPLAGHDLQQAYDFIAGDNRAAADQVLIRITEVLALLASGRVQGREVVLSARRSVRTWSIPPYRIYYCIQHDELQVVRIYHQSRRPIEE